MSKQVFEIHLVFFFFFLYLNRLEMQFFDAITACIKARMKAAAVLKWNNIIIHLWCCASLCKH